MNGPVSCSSSTRWLQSERHAASFVPATFPGQQSSCSAREILVRYGDREDVRRNLAANFSTESWWGPESQHHENKLKWLRDLKVGETNANVLTWLSEYEDLLTRRAERARVEEERDDL